MKRRMTIIVAGLLVLGLQTSVMAQEERSVRFGVGAGIDVTDFTLMLLEDDFFTGGPGFDIFLPVRITDVLIIEPSLAVATVSETTSPEGAAETTDSASIIRFGVGLAYPITLTESTRAYVGVRSGAMFWSSTSEYLNAEDEGVESTETSRTDPFVGLQVGGEYYLSPSFSLGAEVQLTYTIIGDYESSSTEYDVDTTADDSGSTITSNALLIVRWFFL